MSDEEIKKILETVGPPVAYRAFREPQKLPYICYLEAGTNNFAADGVVYHKQRKMHIELYTAYKNQEIENRMEEALSEFFWEKTETYIDSEKCYQITYEIEV